MIETKFATEQLERLSGLSFFPRPVKSDTASQAAFRELRLALECATSDAIAKRVVDDWIRQSPEAPKPAELRKLVYDEIDRAEREDRARYKPPTVAAARCQRCQDTGIAESVKTADTSSSASVCDCGQGSVTAAEEVESINASRRRLAGLGIKGMPHESHRRLSKLRSVADVYGEY